MVILIQEWATYLNGKPWVALGVIQKPHGQLSMCIWSKNLPFLSIFSAWKMTMVVGGLSKNQKVISAWFLNDPLIERCSEIESGITLAWIILVHECKGQFFFRSRGWQISWWCHAFFCCFKEELFSNEVYFCKLSTFFDKPSIFFPS